MQRHETQRRSEPAGRQKPDDDDDDALEKPEYVPNPLTARELQAREPAKVDDDDDSDDEVSKKTPVRKPK